MALKTTFWLWSIIFSDKLVTLHFKTWVLENSCNCFRHYDKTYRSNSFTFYSVWGHKVIKFLSRFALHKTLSWCRIFAAMYYKCSCLSFKLFKLMALLTFTHWCKLQIVKFPSSREWIKPVISQTFLWYSLVLSQW